MGIDHAVDQVARHERFAARHPEVTITSPRQNGSPLWRAAWPPAGEHASMELRDLLDHLEARFGPEAAQW